jgi:hypothetical protein
MDMEIGFSFPASHFTNFTQHGAHGAMNEVKGPGFTCDTYLSLFCLLAFLNQKFGIFNLPSSKTFIKSIANSD